MKKDLIEFYIVLFALLGPPIITMAISSLFDIKETLTQANIMGVLYIIISPPILFKLTFKQDNK